MQLGFSTAITRVIQFVVRGFANLGNTVLAWFVSTSGLYYNGAVNFIATSGQYLSISTNPMLQPLLGDYSITGHFYITTPDNFTIRSLVSFRDSATNKGIYIAIAADKKVIWRFGDGTNNVQSNDTAGAVLALGLHHYAITFTRGGNAVLYIDNAVYSTVSIATVTGTINPTAPFVIGAREVFSIYDYFMDGWVDSMSIWRRALSVADVSWLYNGGNGREYAEINGSVYDTKTSRVGVGLLNGDFQTLGGGGGDTFARWGENYSGTGSVVADTVDPYTGVRSCKYNFGASGNAYVAFDMTQIPGFTVGKVYKLTVVGKASQAIALNISDGYNGVGVGASYFNLFNAGWRSNTTYISFGKYNTGRTSLYLLPASNPANGSVNLGLVTIEEVPLATFWGFKESSSTRYDSRYNNHLTAVNNPTLVAGITASACAATNDPIAKWYDLTDNHKDLQSPAIGNRPTYELNAVNSLPSAKFNGLTQHIGRQEDLIGTGDVTFYFVFKATGYGGMNAGRIIDNGQFLIRYDVNARLVVASDGGTNALSAASSAPLNTWKLGVITRTSAGVVNFRINGVASGGVNQNSGTPVAGGSTYVGNNSSLTRGFNGYLPELVDVRPGIDNLNQIQAREAILKTKYGIV